MSRALIAAGVVLAAVAVIVVIAILTRPDDPVPRVERDLRQRLTQPGHDQIAGDPPRSVRCRSAGERRWSCLVAYPDGLVLECLVGERALDQGPVCGPAPSVTRGTPGQ